MICNQIIDLVKSANTITIYSHMKTDGDAIGSSLALFAYLKNLGKSVTVACDSEIPSNLKFLKDIGIVNTNVTHKGDLAICVDCSDIDRLGRLKFKLSKFKKVIQIDHHFANIKFGNLSLIKPGYSSACEVLFDIFTETKEKITKDMAYYLLVGILTDTGGFSYNSTTSETLEKGATLLRIAEININELTVPLFASHEMNIFNLKKRAYNNVEFYNDNKFALMSISRNDLIECGVSLDDTKALLEIVMSLKPVKVVVMITESEEGVCYVSFRSKDNIDVSKFAGEFGGGGHKQASGCRLYDTLRSAKDKIKAVVKF